MQIEGLNVAINNLNSHSKSLTTLFDEFEPFAVRELSKNSQLLHYFPKDLDTLKLINIHKNILKVAENDTVEPFKQKTLLDFIPLETILIWADNCKVKHSLYTSFITLIM